MQGMRPARLAGFVLLGVAVIAVGLGVFTLTSNGASPSAQGGPPATSTSATQPPTTRSSQHPTTTTSARPTTTTTTTTTTPAAPTTTKPSPTRTTVVSPPNQGKPSLRSTVPVRVYNNSFIKNLAATAGREFRDDGFDVVTTGNYSQGTIPTSTAYYTSLPGEKEVATELGHDFGMRVLPRFSGIAFASPGVIVIVTKDFKGAK